MQETDSREAPYPWKDPTSKIIVLREDKIDVAEEARLYDQICEVWSPLLVLKYSVSKLESRMRHTILFHNCSGGSLRPALLLFSLASRSSSLTTQAPVLPLHKK
jgi:hypothetical protein